MGLRSSLRITICAAMWLCLSAATFANPPCGDCPPAKASATKLGPRRFGPLEPELELGYSREPLIAVDGVPVWSGETIEEQPFPLWDSYYPYAGFYGPYFGWSYRSFYYPFYGPWSYSYGPSWYYFNRPWFGYGPYYYWRGPWWGSRRFF